MNAESRALFFRRLWLIAKPFWMSEKRRTAYCLLGIIFFLLAVVLAMNVWITSVAGKFATALQSKNADAYHYFLMLHIGVILVATPIIVIYHYIRSRLALEWRAWLTEYFVQKYFSHRAYYRISGDSEIDNPDERISQDVDTFCNMTVGLFMAVIDSIITVATFSGLLWTISPTLMVVAIGYSLAGCVLTMFIGNRLVKLNFEHVKLEADLRYSMARVRRDVESIAFYRGEERAAAHIVKSLVLAVKNVEAIIILNRNLGFFTTSYNWFVALIPAAVIAPLYFSGTREFGEITRAGMAFSQVFTGLTLFIGQFNALSAFAANIERLGSFIEKLNACAAPDDPRRRTVIKTVEGNRLQLDHVTIFTPDSSRVLVQELSLAFYKGESLMIIGPSGSGKSSILRALAGLWTVGTGVITRPPLEQVMFLPQQPYVPVSTLREALCYPRPSNSVSTGALLGMLKLVNLEDIPVRVGGLDKEQHWREVLSLGEQQRLSFARLALWAPKFAILDEATSALDPENQRALYTLLKRVGSTVISVGHRESLKPYHDFILELKGDGAWKLYPINERFVPENVQMAAPAPTTEESEIPAPAPDGETKPNRKDETRRWLPRLARRGRVQIGNSYAGLSRGQEEMLDEVQWAHFRYFVEHQSQETGLILDRSTTTCPASIGAVGFALCAYAVAHHRNWISTEEAFGFYHRVLEALLTTPQGDAADGINGYRGWFYHHLAPEDGMRARAPQFWDSELSSMDTALLMAGIRFVRTMYGEAVYGDDSEDARRLQNVCDELFARVEWSWMLDENGLLRHGWTPESGWIPHVYRGYSEALLLYLLALGAEDYAIPAESWNEFIGRELPRTLYGETYIAMSGTPLFCYQYPHCWVDFRRIRDGLCARVGFDYFENSVRAARAQQIYAIANPRGFKGYDALQWGFSACDGPGKSRLKIDGVEREFFGYRERGAPSGFDDGTIAPSAAVASIPFTPDASLRSLDHFVNREPSLLGSCGLYDAFNQTYPAETPGGWVGKEWVAVNQGPIVLMIENFRSELVWEVMKKDPVIRRGLIRAGFEGGWLEGEALKELDAVQRRA